MGLVKNDEKEKGIKVAIIDDGIHESIDSAFRKVSRCYVEKGILYKESSETVEVFSHGTVCAAIITLIGTEIELFDIRIFKNDGAEMADLIIALEYCLSCGVQVVNLSCGTLNYLEYKKVKPTIRKLQKKNVMIVSAFSNQGILSFPASCRKVFGVREDCGKCLKRGEYGFQKYAGGRLENSFVAYADMVMIGGNELTIVGNSFATPVITGEIVRILRAYPGLSFNKVLRQLLQHAESERCMGRELKKTLLCKKKKVGVPVIGINQKCFCLKEFLKEKLRDYGYYVITVSESGIGKMEIPCRYYMDRETVLNKDMLYTIEQIYSPDVIIFFLNKHRFKMKNRSDVVDIMFSEKHGGIWLETEKKGFFCNRYADIFAYMMHFFSGEAQNISMGE